MGAIKKKEQLLYEGGGTAANSKTTEEPKSPQTSTFGGITGLINTAVSTAGNAATKLNEQIAAGTDPATLPGVTVQKETPSYMDQALEMLANQPAASYTPGTYKSPYSEQIDSIINDILNSKYGGYDAENDPTYSQYKKTYLREADRTAEDVLGQYAAMNGGMPSTAAISAASQAGNNFKGQLADKIPELEAAAYDRYLAELSGKRQNLSDLMTMEELAYGRFTDEENRKLAEYQQAQTEFDTALSRLLQGAEIAQNQEASAASKALSQMGYGVMPSAEGLAALGIDEATAKSLMASAAGTGLSEETAMALLKLSLDIGVAPSAAVLSALGQSTQWGDAAVSNAVASANGGEMTAYGNYELAQDAMEKFTGTDEDRLMQLVAMVENGSITQEQMQELYYEYADEYADDRKKAKGEALTADDVPLQNREWKFESSGGNNWFGGIDNNAKVKDQFGNIYRMDDLYDALVESGMNKKEAEAYVLLIQAQTGVVKS